MDPTTGGQLKASLATTENDLIDAHPAGGMMEVWIERIETGLADQSVELMPEGGQQHLNHGAVRVANWDCRTCDTVQHAERPSGWPVESNRRIDVGCWAGQSFVGLSQTYGKTTA